MTNPIDFSLFGDFDNADVKDWLKSSGAGFFRELSGAEYLRQLRASGVKIRDSDFYRIRRETLGLNRNEERIRRLRKTTPIPESYINYSHSFNIQQDYLYRYRAQYFDETTGKTVNTYASFITNERLSTQDAINKIEEQMSISPNEHGTPEGGFTILSLSYVLGREGN